MNCVRAGRAVHDFSNAAVILGTMNIIINITMVIVNHNNIIGYIIAHFTFHFNSIFSNRF
ncbi:MAG: hypothetical protein Q8S84_03415 [bacterium]|nr:hypothetical protein [bacterium]MDP3380574.1 hypothetical protein [bacterium]